MLKIISDGTSEGTKVVLIVDGIEHQLPYVDKIKWEITRSGFATATIDILNLHFEGTIESLSLVKIIQVAKEELCEEE